MANGQRLLWLNVERTIFVESFDGGRTLNVATRESPGHTWGPPMKLQPDATTAKLFEAFATWLQANSTTTPRGTV